MRLGTLLAAIGKDAQLTDEEFAVFTQRDRTPHDPIDLE